MHGVTGFLESAAVLVCCAFVLLTFCSRIGVPSIIGYILTGLLVGPTGFGLLAEGESLATIGEIGVILLLFALGLEFSFEKLASLKRLIIGAGAAQVLITGGLVAVLIAWIVKLAPIPSIVVGGAVAMSSTALCLKVLSSVGALSSTYGRITIAILLFQDLAAVALLLLHDAVTGSTNGNEVLKLIGGASALIVALFVARGPLQQLAKWIAGLGDPELAQLLALAIALAAAVAAVAVGLSPALAAFAAGMIIGEGDARHVVEKEIRPFRDLLVGVFFIGIGTQLQLVSFLSNWPIVLIWLCILIVGKSLIATAIVLYFGEPREAAWRTGVILAHGGEFSLMLLSVSMGSGLMPFSVGEPLLLAIGVSMIGASLLIRFAARE